MPTELWYRTRKSGVTEEYVRVVQEMYESCKTVVRCVVGESEEFKVEVGLHQESARRGRTKGVIYRCGNGEHGLRWCERRGCRG